MPVLDGVETCRRIRAAGRDVPVVMLSPRGDVEERLRGFEAGADDYVLKPFNLRGLIARLTAQAKRSSSFLRKQLEEHGGDRLIWTVRAVGTSSAGTAPTARVLCLRGPKNPLRPELQG